MNERIYVYYWKTGNQLIFVKEKNLESFMFECKKEFNNNEFKSFGTFMINYQEGLTENASIQKVIKLVYNRRNFKRCGIFIPAIEIKQKGNTPNTGSRPYISAQTGHQGLDPYYPLKVEHNHIINPPNE